VGDGIYVRDMAGGIYSMFIQLHLPSEGDTSEWSQDQEDWLLCVGCIRLMAMEKV